VSPGCVFFHSPLDAGFIHTRNVACLVGPSLVVIFLDFYSLGVVLCP